LSDYLIHIPKESSLVKVDDQVIEGQQIARCGFVGATQPHIQWVVYKKTDQMPSLQSLKIQHKKPVEDLLEK